ncbi:cytochrome b/b6 domain-containing protein, partial [Escherichia coli]|uniref:cytochrome b/b6 domain-containing protein n=1 Tax=Escherichia coli TaxID=562 RepID=UPI00192A4450
YVGQHKFDTTGVLGLSNVGGVEADRAFPSWATLPSNQDLATGRRWHFLFAWLLVINGAIYLLYGLISGQLRRRLIPEGDQIRDFGGSVKEHLLLRFPEGEEAKRYNVIQKLTYLGVVLILLPAMVLAGLAMSPGVDAAWPWLTE